MGVVDFQTSGNSAVCSMANAGRDGDGGELGGGGGGVVTWTLLGVCRPQGSLFEPHCRSQGSILGQMSVAKGLILAEPP